jgi:glycogen debranching enzyme
MNVGTPSGFNATTPSASLLSDDGTITLLEGQTFQLSDSTGDMRPSEAHGLIVLDTRVVSRWELTINGHPVEPLAHEVSQPFRARIVGRGRPAAGHADADLVVVRDRDVGNGMRERIEVTNHGLSPVETTIELRCDTDFAHLFEVKERRVGRLLGRHMHELTENSLVFGHVGDRGEKEVTITLSGDADLSPGLATWRRTLGPGEHAEFWCEVTVALGGQSIRPRFTRHGDDEAAEPQQRMDRWHATTPSVDTDHPALTAVLARSAEDLGALRIFDPEHPDLPILAAGAPWFMTVFGRDSLLTAWMTLIADPSLAHGVLETLARFQGTDVDPRTEEEPGKILHEMRFGGAGGLALGGGDRYYGSIDATPLFVMLLGELVCWDARDELIERLVPHADRAIEWIEQFGDRDGDGYVEYQRLHDQGLVNQGWKDSWDAIRHADGELAPTPIALCEVQGYVYAAYRARASIARVLDDEATATRCDERADELRHRFDEDFWLDDHGTYALGLDGDKRPIEAVASNVGHCLWTGIVRDDRAASVADTLLSKAHFSGFGVRTLSTDMRAYNPVSYHNGSVWPHDNAIAAAGLARYGLRDHAGKIIMAQLRVASAMGGRLPELFAGFDRTELSVPAPYPSSCSPQAWAAAAPLLWLRTMLGLQPAAAADEVHLSPHLPSGIERLRVDGVRIAGRELTIDVDGTEVRVTGDCDGLDIQIS